MGAPLPWPRGGATAPGNTPSPSGDASTSADPRNATAAKILQDERKHLADWFSGTPVVIEIDREGGLRVDVPMEFAFDAGQIKPKPALVAVLDRVGVSLRRAATTRVQASAPADAQRTDAGLAERRTVAVREAIMGRGVNAIRMVGGVPANLLSTGVCIRILVPLAAP
jgi:outer membrane protein OmpA-like peptidoglycan-associated protein